LRSLNLRLLNPRFDVAQFHAPPRPNLVRRWSDAALQARSQSVWADGRALCGFIEVKKTIVVGDIRGFGSHRSPSVRAANAGDERALSAPINVAHMSWRDLGRRHVGGWWSERVGRIVIALPGD
jgi:hypothetical protein